MEKVEQVEAEVVTLDGTSIPEFKMPEPPKYKVVQYETDDGDDFANFITKHINDGNQILQIGIKGARHYILVVTVDEE